MSNNALDITNWAWGLGPACPPLATVEAALAAVPKTYAQNGDVLFNDPNHPELGTVTLTDADDGVVHISCTDGKAPGAVFCVKPTGVSLDPKGRGFATVEWNTATARGADQRGWLWVRVDKMATQDSAARPFVPSGDWLTNGYSIGDEFGGTDWIPLLTYLKNQWQPPRAG